MNVSRKTKKNNKTSSPSPPAQQCVLDKINSAVKKYVVNTVRVKLNYDINHEYREP